MSVGKLALISTGALGVGVLVGLVFGRLRKKAPAAPSAARPSGLLALAS